VFASIGIRSCVNKCLVFKCLRVLARTSLKVFTDARTCFLVFKGTLMCKQVGYAEGFQVFMGAHINFRVFKGARTCLLLFKGTRTICHAFKGVCTSSQVF